MDFLQIALLKNPITPLENARLPSSWLPYRLTKSRDFRDFVCVYMSLSFDNALRLFSAFRSLTFLVGRGTVDARHRNISDRK